MPPDSSVRILFVGDMHLGRLPSRVPTAVLDQGALTLRDLGPAAAWERIVAAALSHQVHAVALAGDLVEKDNAMFEAYGPLATGVRRLVADGITVAAVAGNHDTQVLPKLAAEIDGFHLLGPGGTWSTVDIPGSGGFSVRLAGWSFPSRHHSASPLLSPPPPPEGATFGLLHADRDASRSSYAPVRSVDLAAVGYQGWFLGHVHKPDEVVADGSPFYLGSVTGLDPHETGRHGPVLVQVEAGGKTTAERLPLAPLRWEHREIDASELDDPVGQTEGFLIRQLNLLFRELDSELDETLALGVRFILKGSVTDPAALDRVLHRLDTTGLVTRHEGTTLFLQKISSRVSLRVDLRELARQADPPGLLARQILALEDPLHPVPGVRDPARLAEDLMAEGFQATGRADREAAFGALAPEGETVTSAQIRDMLILAGRRALAGLLAQVAAKEADRAVG